MIQGPGILAKLSHTICCVNVTNCRRVELVGGAHPGKKENKKPCFNLRQETENYRVYLQGHS